MSSPMAVKLTRKQILGTQEVAAEWQQQYAKMARTEGEPAADKQVWVEMARQLQQVADADLKYAVSAQEVWQEFLDLHADATPSNSGTSAAEHRQMFVDVIAGLEETRGYVTRLQSKGFFFSMAKRLDEAIANARRSLDQATHVATFLAAPLPEVDPAMLAASRRDRDTGNYVDLAEFFSGPQDHRHENG